MGGTSGSEDGLTTGILWGAVASLTPTFTIISHPPLLPTPSHPHPEFYAQYPFVLKVLVPQSQAGATIGSGGENLRQVERDCDCHLKMSQAVQTYPGTDARILVIRGKEDDLVKAGHAMALVLERAQNKYIPANQPPDPLTLRLVVPDRVVGLLIGRQGENIKRLQDISNSHINIAHKVRGVGGRGGGEGGWASRTRRCAKPAALGPTPHQPKLIYPSVSLPSLSFLFFLPLSPSSLTLGRCSARLAAHHPWLLSSRPHPHHAPARRTIALPLLPAASGGSQFTNRDCTLW